MFVCTSVWLFLFCFILIFSCCRIWSCKVRKRRRRRIKKLNLFLLLATSQFPIIFIQLNSYFIIGISSIIHCSFSTSSTLDISNVDICLDEDKRIWYSRIYEHSPFHALTHPHTRLHSFTRLLHRSTTPSTVMKIYEKKKFILSHLQLMFGHIDLLLFIELYQYTFFIAYSMFSVL